MRRFLPLITLLLLAISGCGGGKVQFATPSPLTGTAKFAEHVLRPTLIGAPVVGQVLTASSGSWGGTPVSYQYQYKRCNTSGLSCSPVTTLSATPTYTVVTADIGSTLRVYVTATNPAGSTTQFSDATDPATGGGTPSFVAGACSPGCTVTSSPIFATVSAADSATGALCGTVCGTGSPLTLSGLSYQIYRPGNLQTSPAPPMVITFDDTQSSPAHQHWLAAAAAHGFVVVAPQNVGAGGGNQYPSIFKPTVSGARNCGTNADRKCDTIPYVQAVLNAVECPYTGSGACQGVNPNEVYVEGGSHGATLAMDVACDTRTAAQIHGVQATSTVFFSNVSGTFTNSTAAVSCPAVFGPPTPCNYDCVTLSPLVTNQSWQWLWGTDDTQFVDNTNCPWVSPSGSNGNNCMGTGYTSSSGPFWVFGDNYMAQTKFGAGRGCSTTPVSTVTSGLASKTLTTTYSGCANAPNPSITATQTVQITGAVHLPEGPPCQAGATEALCQFGDGISTPNSAYTFWSTYPAL